MKMVMAGAMVTETAAFGISLFFHAGTRIGADR
jgi:hypothetical protein